MRTLVAAPEVMDPRLCSESLPVFSGGSCS